MRTIHFFFLALLFFISGITKSQDISIGLKGGISWTTINGRWDYKNLKNSQIKNITEHSFGLMLNYKLCSHFVVQTEINIERKGFDFKVSNDYNGLGYHGNYRLKYLNIPITVHYELGKNVNYYIYTGIYLARLLKAENYTSISLSYPSSYRHLDESYDPTDEFNKSVLGGIVGLGIKIPLCETVQFIIDSRYQLDLTKAAKNTEYSYDPNQYLLETPNNFQNVYTRSFTMSVGVLYKIPNKK